MPNPFPGIDPYVETSGLWPGMHATLLTYYQDLINERLPANYVARSEFEVHLVREPDPTESLIRPDVAVLQRDPSARRAPADVGSVATLEPVKIALKTPPAEEVRERWIEIRQFPELALVTVIELLSPSNKARGGRSDYLERREELIRRPVHLVELDLLLGGHRLPMRKPLPAGHFYAIVSRAEQRPDSQVYAWSVRDPLPRIPIPLVAPDPDIPLDLGAAYAKAYESGRYAMLLRNRDKIPRDLGPNDLAWVEKQARGESA